MAMAGKEGKSQQHELQHIDAGKYVSYTPEQVEALERVYMECPKPSSLRRQQIIRECPILSNIEPKQIKVWFQNRRCREKQRKEASRLQTVKRKLSAMNKLLMEENDLLQKQVSHLIYENGCMHQHIHTPSATTTDTSRESVVTSGPHKQQQNTKLQHLQRDANNPSGLLAIAEETLSEFLSKATGTSVEWVQMVGLKPGSDSIGIIAVSHNCSGVAARACGLVSLEPPKVTEILKARPSWYCDFRCLNVATVIPAGNGGNIELIYMQVKVGIKGAEEFGDYEEWFNYRILRAAPESCAEFLGSFVADKTTLEFTKGGKWLVWKFEGDRTLGDYLKNPNFPFNIEPTMFGRILEELDPIKRSALIIKQIMRQIITSLKRIHDTGIVHRDIKPANLVVTKRDRSNS